MTALHFPSDICSAHPLNAHIRGMIIHLAKTASEESEFFRKHKEILQYKDNDLLLSSLIELGHRCLIITRPGPHGEMIAGVLAYQMHEDEWHAYLFHTFEGFRGQGVATELLGAWMTLAHEARVYSVRMYAGDRGQSLSADSADAMQKLYGKAVGKRLDLPFAYGPHPNKADIGWIGMIPIGTKTSQLLQGDAARCS